MLLNHEQFSFNYLQLIIYNCKIIVEVIEFEQSLLFESAGQIPNKTDMCSDNQSEIGFIYTLSAYANVSAPYFVVPYSRVKWGLSIVM